MKRSFILLDHSIEDTSGHYLEYARRVLRAARERGFRTVLAINKRAGDIICPEADVIDKAFARTYWENQALRGAGLLADIVRCDVTAVDIDSARRFADELCALVKRVKVSSGNLVFVPTLGGTELLGIAIYSKLAEALALDWHLLYRRDLPDPKSIVHAKELIKRIRVISAFKAFSKRFDKGAAYFYADTEELTAQYNKLATFRFATLPIPIDDSIGVKNRTQGMPLIVSYLGDAREEKGFHLLPELINDVRAAGFGEDRVKFRIQANLPLARNTKKAIRAKNELIEQEGIGVGVEILEGPFDTAQYNELICSSDVILIPYCAKSYQARSSGIFAEALAAGVPTIFPRGSWMEKSQGGSGSVGFDRYQGILTALIKVLSRYSEYESRSQRCSRIWRQRHSAANLVDSLTKRATNVSMVCSNHNMRIGNL